MITKRTLQQFMSVRRPLLFSRMPRMLRDDGRMAAALEHAFRYGQGMRTAMPLARWKAALERSRIMRVHRRTAGHAR